MTQPVAALSFTPTGPDASRACELIYGGYANGRGEVVLFARELAYRINAKNRSVQQCPRLNPGAQARYDATDAGESFEYGKKTFQRLSLGHIIEICASGKFRLAKTYGSR